MKHQLYFPSRHGDQVNWLRNFKFKLLLYAATLQLQPAELNQALADLDWLIFVLGELQHQSRRHALACTSLAKSLMTGKGAEPVAMPVYEMPSPPAGIAPVKPGALKRIFKLVQGIKSNRHYVESMGLEFGIVGNLHVTDSSLPTFKLALKAGDTAQEVIGTFSLYGRNGVYVETRRGDGDWEVLGIFCRTKFIDARPLLDPTRPEVREYRLRYWDAKPYGDMTAVAKITVSP